MSTRMKIAFGCYLLVTAALTMWGVGFLLRDEFTAYHSVAVGMPWSEVPRQFQILILALMKLAGGLWVTISLCILVLLFGPFRRRERWALWAIPLLIVFECLAPMPAMAHVTMNTPAMPPWVPTIVFIVIAVLGLGISVTESADKHGV